MLSLLAMVIALGAGGYYFTQSAFLNRIAAGAFEKLIGCSATVGQTQLGWDTITLDHVKITIPAGQPNAGKLFQAGKIVLHMHPWSAVFGAAKPSAIDLDQAALFVTENVANGSYNYEQLHFSTPPGSSSSPSLPSVRLHHATVRFGQVIQGQYHSTGTLHIKGTFDQDSQTAHAFKFALTQVHPGSAGNPSGTAPANLKLTGVLNLKPLNVQIQLKHFSFKTPQRNFLPLRVRQWWDRLKPKGSLPTVKVELTSNPAGGMHLNSARLVVHNVSLTLPWGKHNRPRMTDVSGRFTAARHKVRVVNLEGKIAGLDYTINGHIDGYAPDAPFQVSAVTRQFTVPEQPQYIFALPSIVQKQYSLLSPSGTFEVQAAAMRHTKGGPIEYGGRVKLINAKAVFSHFRYPLHDVQGLITFDEKQLRVEHLTGIGPTGANISMDSGTITPPDIGGQVRMHMEATNVPVDKALLSAVKPGERKAIEMFIDRDARKRLSDAGLLKKFTSDNAFKLGGKIHRVAIDIYRPLQPPGQRKPLLVTATLDMTGLQSIFKFWPYPLRCTGGSVTIAPHLITVHHVDFKGLTGATGWLDGTVDTGNRPDKIIPHLRIRDAHFPVDPLLVASVPAPQNLWLKRLDLQGNATCNGRIFKNDKHQFDFSLDAAISGAIAKPFNSHFDLTHISAAAHIRRGLFELLSANASHENSKISARGSARWPETGKPQINMALTGKHLAVSQSLLGLLPSKLTAADELRALIKKYDLTGQFNLALEYDSLAKAGHLYTATLSPLSSSFTYAGTPVHLDHMTGQMAVQPGLVKFKKMGGSNGQARFSLTGEIKTDTGEINTFLNASDTSLGLLEHAFLPKALMTGLRRLDWQGGYQAHDLHVSYHPTAKLHQLAWQVGGAIHLEHTRLNPGVPIKQLEGPVAIDLKKYADQHWPTIRLSLHGGDAKVWGRTLDPLSLTLIGDASDDALRLSRLRAKTYGGIIDGSGLFQLHTGGSYDIHLTIQDADLDGFMHPAQEDEKVNSDTRHQRMDVSDSGTDNNDRGTLSARVALRGLIGQIDKRRGSGFVLIRGAKLFDQPLSLALLQAANLSLPTADSFDRASARLAIRGNTIRFSPLRLETPSLAIAGTGTMTLPDTKVSLRMYCRNPKGTSLGMLSEMVNVLRDELVCVQVTGTLTHPHAENVSLEGIRKTWDQLFNDRASADTVSHPILSPGH